jgi:hypothetical protein
MQTHTGEERAMIKTTILASATAVAIVAGAFFAAAPQAADKTPAAQNVTTVWVNGKGQKAFAETVNEQHGMMEAQGWKFADMEIYIEDGDMQGAFVTYVK